MIGFSPFGCPHFASTYPVPAEAAKSWVLLAENDRLRICL